MERQRENWSCVHDIRLVTITDHGGTHWRVLSIIRSSSNILESLVGMDWVGPTSPPFSLTGTSYHISH